MDEQIDAMLLENVSKPVAFFDSDGILTRSNRAWEMLWCEPAEAFLVLAYDDLVERLHLPPFDEIQMLDNCKTTFNRKSIIVIRHRILMKQASGIMVEIEDVTSLEENTTLIISTMADAMPKIRSRVSSVQNVLTLLVDYPELRLSGDDSRELLIATRREMWDLSRHIECMRDLMALHSGGFSQQIRPERFDLRDLLNLVRIECAPVVPTGKDDKALLFEFDDRELQLFSDQHICHHVIATVVFNAFTYSDNMDPVRVRIRKENASSQHITVSDNGWGIPSDEQNMVFSYGFRGRQARQSDIAGLGISLFLARKMLNLLNSEISFTSKQGAGSQFEIRLRELPSDDQ